MTYRLFSGGPEGLVCVRWFHRPKKFNTITNNNIGYAGLVYLCLKFGDKLTPNA